MTGTPENPRSPETKQGDYRRAIAICAPAASVHAQKLLFAVFLLLALVFASKTVRAADAELVMFGSRNCVYCTLFKRDVARNYRWSQLGKRAPLREVDMEANGSGGYSLKTDITVTPTFIMFKKGREVARIPGYPGRRNFFRLVKHMLKTSR